MEESVIGSIKELFACKEQDIRAYSPLTLAYIGDAVHDLVIRSVVVERANRPVRDLHRTVIGYVKAPSQAAMVDAILPMLSETEESVYRRGRNAKPYTMAKNATIMEYKKATGFEALIGFLYLTDQMDRALELIKKGIELTGMEI